ncbi:hypothetical protein D1610_06565 [Sphingomonas gilva]|uniref:DUF4267 domain-containing protein n=1 Tax=Sphingomonas gilva TaxID=2305907 RepID=A0A396RUM5_9SPHN|nr:hypothetical protein [Sphingomonas gilva]RHW18143.1 hypothetical protein D1610_06565 [Sphingomonas gilva]
MDYKKLGLGLGVFSIALGLAELIAARRVAGALDAEGHERLVKGFGARELLAGANLIAAPAHATNVWNRVAGDAMDLGALALAARRAPRNRAVWGAIAFVVGATILDVVTARGLDRQTGKTSPARAAPA